MSVFRVVQWSVDPPDRDACDRALEAVAAHVRTDHPGARSFRTYVQSFGPHAARTYFAVFEFESLAAWDHDGDSPICEEGWAPIRRLAHAGSFVMSFLSDPQPESTPDGRACAGTSEECGALDGGGG